MAKTEISRETIAKDIHDYLSEYFMLLPSLGVSSDTSLIDSGIIDSTGASELVAFLEARYDILVQDDEFVPDNLDSIDKISAFISRKLAASSARVA